MSNVAGYAEGFGAKDADVEVEDGGADEEDGDSPGNQANDESLLRMI